MQQKSIALSSTPGLLFMSPISTARYGEEAGCEPLVIYDVSGNGIGGPIHLHLVVYSDGLTAISSLVVTQLKADFDRLSPDRARALVEKLVAAGALEMTDAAHIVDDMPLTTVTVFAGGGITAAHNTFSFRVTDTPALAAVASILNAFIDETFPR